ncbi:hypothetical protein AK830_g6420 [Neonectria ditissima]|uniref:aldehyde dehydrogenase (NAD(+)) n=1 Tax=Neonectria ditissima TaxID=78410 RepID=A0A0P7BIB5_9HYPO|nr:hypothetical protein AK830_g6420 [Neonectria ditissima]
MTATTAISITFDQFSNIIDGKRSETKRARHGVNPSTLESLAAVPLSESADVDLAVSVAKRAAPGWGRVPLAERQSAVIRYADAIEARAGDFATMLVREQGKLLAAANGELVEAVKFLKVVASLPFAEQEPIEDIKQRRVFTRYVPIGVAVGIVPWNFAALLLDKVSFTGSTQTGRKVMESCSKTLKRVTLELGGNDPAIICGNVDVASVAQKVATFALYNSGQVCVAIKRIYVHSSIYSDFMTALVKITESMTVGDGFDPNSFLGPVQNKMQYERIQELIRSVRDANLKVALGKPEAANTSGKGYFVSPIIVDNPPGDSTIVTEEPFGPIFPVLRWDSEEDVIQRANNSDMGLGASIWTRDPEQAERFSNRLEAGNIWINAHLLLQPNAPFGGHKSSGVGVEGGIDGIKSFCKTQTVYNYKDN